MAVTVATLPEGALSAAAVLATVGVRSQPAAFVKSDVMAELSQLGVCGQTSQPFCVLLSEQSVRLSSPPTSLKTPSCKANGFLLDLESLVECVHEFVMYSLAFIDPLQYYASWQAS